MPPRTPSHQGGLRRSRLAQERTCSAPRLPGGSSRSFLFCHAAVFQVALRSRCSQSHMCFFAPSNDIFPMQTVASTAFAGFVTNTNPTCGLVFFLTFSVRAERGPFSPLPPPVPAPREDVSLQPLLVSSHLSPPTPTELCQICFASPPHSSPSAERRC